MLNRRLIRIKVFKVLYSNVIAETNSMESAQKELLHSCEKTKELTMFMLNFAVALTSAAQEKIDLGLQKFHPTKEEATPNTKFAENGLAQLLLEKEDFVKYCQSNGLLWNGDMSKFVKKMLASISEKDYFREYMSVEQRSLEEDCELFLRIFEEEFEDNQEIDDILEEVSLYWIDDLDYSLNVVLRLILSIKDGKKFKVPSLFIKEEDRDYALQLFAYAYTNYNRLLAEINDNLSNWDPERIVGVDMTLIVLGLAEAMKFPSIPVKVTINEFVEISKYYSTVNSKTFVNGLLDKIIQQKIARGEISKTGRGLIES